MPSSTQHKESWNIPTRTSSEVNRAVQQQYRYNTSEPNMSECTHPIYRNACVLPYDMRQISPRFEVNHIPKGNLDLLPVPVQDMGLPIGMRFNLFTKPAVGRVTSLLKRAASHMLHSVYRAYDSPSPSSTRRTNDRKDLPQHKFYPLSRQSKNQINTTAHCGSASPTARRILAQTRGEHETVRNNLFLTRWVRSSTSSAFQRPRHRLAVGSDRDSTTRWGVGEGRTYDRYHRQIDA